MKKVIIGNILFYILPFVQVSSFLSNPQPFQQQIYQFIQKHPRNSKVFQNFAQYVDSNGVPIDVLNGHKAYPQQTPHSGRHFQPTHIQDLRKKKSFRKFMRLPFLRRKKRRFMEGWYYRLTLTEAIVSDLSDETNHSNDMTNVNESFAFIFSIEDPHTDSIHDVQKKQSSPLMLSCAQIMGPGDSYLVQAERNDTNFWAWKNSQGLGCTFEYNNEQESVTSMSPEQFRNNVKTGFQMLPYSLQGKIVGHDGSKGGIHENEGTPGTCDWDMEIIPIYGWGDSAIKDNKEQNLQPQLSSAGWLASYPVFEPHWQITMAHARASGTVTWKNKRYTFQNQPFYAEKNWGGSFPLKWYWIQCNAFLNEPNLAVTCGGGVRKLPFLGDKTEQLGLVGVHYNNIFYEAVPWTGTMEWEVKEWGSWKFLGRCTSSGLSKRLFEVEVEATCTEDVPGIKLRAPTKEDGMVYFCRDSFYATVTLSLYHLDYDSVSKTYKRSPDKAPIIDNAISHQCAVEVGGGPWWDTWKGKSDMKQPMKSMVQFPYIARQSRDKLKNVFRKRNKNIYP